MANSNIPVDVVHLLPALDARLIELLKSLRPHEWQMQTVAKLWTVKDVVAHLLDGNIRILSILRDGHYGKRPNIKSHEDLVSFLNGLNADWVKAMDRVSAEMLIVLHELTGPMYCDYYQSINPSKTAVFSVAWAGESESKNWMHIAREYTEKWLHQQQIREAVNKPGLITKDFFYPFIDVFMYALPHTYRDVSADDGTIIQVTISTDVGGSWLLTRTGGKWVLSKQAADHPEAEIIIDPDTAWKLFSKSITPAEAKNKVTIHGNQALGEVAMTMVSVMA